MRFYGFLDKRVWDAAASCDPGDGRTVPSWWRDFDQQRKSHWLRKAIRFLQALLVLVWAAGYMQGGGAFGVLLGSLLMLESAAFFFARHQLLRQCARADADGVAGQVPQRLSPAAMSRIYFWYAWPMVPTGLALGAAVLLHWATAPVWAGRPLTMGGYFEDVAAVLVFLSPVMYCVILLLNFFRVRRFAVTAHE